MHKYNKFAKVHFMKLAKYEKDAFAYNKVVGSQLPHARCS